MQQALSLPSSAPLLMAGNRAARAGQGRAQTTDSFFVGALHSIAYCKAKIPDRFLWPDFGFTCLCAALLRAQTAEGEKALIMWDLGLDNRNLSSPKTLQEGS